MVRFTDTGSQEGSVSETAPLFTLFPASGDDVTNVFTLFDELEEWLAAQLPAAFEWIRSGLAVRFDQEFCTAVQHAQQEGAFTKYLRHAEAQQEMSDNMDFF